jgi:hypothetical protein
VNVTRWLKIAIIAAVLAVVLFRVSLWALFHHQEAAILQAARRVSSPPDVQTFVAKYNVVYHPPSDYRTGDHHECNYYSQPAPFYVHHHYFSWYFDESGRRTSYYRETYREIFGMEFTESEAVPAS